MNYLTITGLRHLRMPMIGLGTWRAPPEEVQNSVLQALDIGYRHIDTAFNYNNEEAIGLAIEKWLEMGKGNREDLFITTKLPHIGNRSKDVEQFLKLSLNRLKLDYVDLYLIHMPFAFQMNETTMTPLQNPDGTFVLDTETDNVSTWAAMEEQVRNGYAKAIGLSNFNAEQIAHIYQHSTIKPSVLQVEMHAYCQQTQLIKDCRLMNISLTAYAPLGSPGAQIHFSTKYNYNVPNYPDILGQPVVGRIAEKHRKTNGQILLRHLLQKDVSVIPKSTNSQRLKENFNIFNFTLDDEDMAELNNLDKGEDGRIFDFKFFAGVEKHPEYPFKNLLKQTEELA